MKLTKSQRCTAYCIMLKEFKLEFYPSLCCLITDLGWFDAYDDEKTFKSAFPELYKFKKYNKHKAYWFANDKQRILALKQCIAETENF